MILGEQNLSKFYPTKIDIEGCGYVQLVEVNGTDSSIDQIARVVEQEDMLRMPNEVEDLLDYMIRHEHTSPFEFVGITIFVECPIFVARQWFRHRTGKYSEVSGRYRDVSELGAYCPPLTHLRKTAPSRKQGSSDELVDSPEDVQMKMSHHYEQGKELYDDLVYNHGLSKEVARTVLSQSNLTHFYFQLDLNNILRFIKLRTHDTAQFQTRFYAEDAIAHFISCAFPITYKKFLNHVKNAVRFSADELHVLGINEDALKKAKDRMSKGRYQELLEKIERVRSST